MNEGPSILQTRIHYEPWLEKDSIFHYAEDGFLEHLILAMLKMPKTLSSRDAQFSLALACTECL
jgi:hypothetical protein